MSPNLRPPAGDVPTSEPLTVSLADQIAEVKREVAIRREFYPRWIATGRLSPALASRQIDRMTAVLRTLEMLDQFGIDGATGGGEQ